jgi:cytochrome c peroxidase
MKKPALLFAGLATAAAVVGLLVAGVVSLPFKAKEAAPPATLVAGSAPVVSAPASDWRWNLPTEIPEPWVPPENPMTETKFQLGRHLFYDKRLSGNGTFACASCHFQNLAFTDGKAVSAGSTKELTHRSSQSIANAAYHPTITWANFSLNTLERQVPVPLVGDNPVEMGLNDENIKEVLARISTDMDYQQRFKQAFPSHQSPVSLDNIINAIATFERGVLSFNSKYDQVNRGQAAYSVQEARGKALFFSDKAQCAQCHSGFNFTEMTMQAKPAIWNPVYRNTGLYNVDGKGAYPDQNQGLIGVSGKAEDMGKFRVASLRNIEVTAPYMHDGSIATLEQVLAFYAAGGRNIPSGPNKGDGRKNPFKDERMNKIKLSKAEQADIIAFLKTLTDTEFLTNPRFTDPFKSH